MVSVLRLSVVSCLLRCLLRASSGRTQRGMDTPHVLLLKYKPHGTATTARDTLQPRLNTFSEFWHVCRVVERACDLLGSTATPVMESTAHNHIQGWTCCLSTHRCTVTPAHRSSNWISQFQSLCQDETLSSREKRSLLQVRRQYRYGWDAGMASMGHCKTPLDRRRAIQACVKRDGACGRALQAVGVMISRGCAPMRQDPFSRTHATHPRTICSPQALTAQSTETTLRIHRSSCRPSGADRDRVEPQCRRHILLR